MNRILLLGGTGILGSEVQKQLQLMKIDYVAPKSSDLDVRDRDSFQSFASNFRPNWIINCTAWTNVDGAEDSFQAALELNVVAVKNIAEVAKLLGSHVIHISTDYVFDGNSPKPYDENSQVGPINKYGESKLLGEKTLFEILPTTAYVIRTSWLYGINGKNFVKTIAIKALERKETRVVNDQIGSPTSAQDLAKGIYSIVVKVPEGGIYNFSNKGSCSWFELARAIYKEVGADPELVQAISSSSLDLKARRPKYSLLSKAKWEGADLNEIPDWKASLKKILPEIISNPNSKEKL